MKKRGYRRLGAALAICLAMTAVTGCGKQEQAPTATEQTQAQATQKTETGETAKRTMGQIDAESFDLPTGPEESSIFINPVPDISDDFIRGVDVSSALAEEQSGVKYYGEDGTEQDIMKTLAQAGVNYVRLRVWNDPYDEDGNGYGGGNNDVATALELGKRATQYGMKVCIDFHYSDFWADPAKQFVPKAWKDMKLSEKSEALYAFTKESLEQLLDAGVDVGMVQVGNEINYGMSGETIPSKIHELLKSGSKAVRDVSAEYDHDMSVVIHYTNLSNAGEIDGLVGGLTDANVDFDIVGLSYYTFWHGDFETMQKVAEEVQSKYKKQVMIAETSYCYTSEDGDGSGNSIGGVDDIVKNYPATVQSQATMIRDVCAAASEADVIGVFYWEPAWIPVGAPDADNSPIWEKYGSGWASSYAAEYDPDDAGQYYGGSSWDNQAMFDWEGKPLASLDVWKYLKYGCTTDLAIELIPDVDLDVNVGTACTLPDEVDVIYNDRSANKKLPVTWNADDVKKIDTEKGGSYDVSGTLDSGERVSAHMNVSLLNYIANPSFEENDRSMWKVTAAGSDPTDYQEKPDDAHSGDFSYHWWSETKMDFSIEQELTELPAGTYELSAFIQGGDTATSATMELYVTVNGTEQSTPFMVSGWCEWQNPKISQIQVQEGDTVVVGARAKLNARSWGTMDDFTLNRISD